MRTLSVADAQDVQEVGVQLQPAAPEALGRHGARVQLPQSTFIALSTAQMPISRPHCAGSTEYLDGILYLI